VHERPVDIRDSDVAAALARQWALTVQDMSYLPVGFGGYHWLAVDQTGSRWFVTVSDLAAPWVPDLPAAMQTAAWAGRRLSGRPACPDAVSVRRRRA
jgi:spectinomycin phosphotransferase